MRGIAWSISRLYLNICETKLISLLTRKTAAIRSWLCTTSLEILEQLLHVRFPLHSSNFAPEDIAKRHRAAPLLDPRDRLAGPPIAGVAPEIPIDAPQVRLGPGNEPDASSRSSRAICRDRCAPVAT